MNKCLGSFLVTLNLGYNRLCVVPDHASSYRTKRAHALALPRQRSEAKDCAGPTGEATGENDPTAHFQKLGLSENGLAKMLRMFIPTLK